jgi:hypothetical protein
MLMSLLKAYLFVTEEKRPEKFGKLLISLEAKLLAAGCVCYVASFAWILCLLRKLLFS